MPALWATDTVVSSGSFGGKTALPNGSSMYPGQWVDSPNGAFRLLFQKDGNLVLLQLPSTVLWATATENQGATWLIMQHDGNLVIYADEDALWSSDTDHNDGAYLSLQNDGNLVIYSFESLEKLAVWAMRPNWRGGMSETLEWMTTVAESPMAFEQRMGLRLSPRQRLECSYMLTGPTRTYLDLLTIATAGSPIYVPLWHDVCHLTVAASSGATTIYLDTSYTELQTCRYAILVNLDPFTYELVEIAGYGPDHLDLATPITGSWLIGTRVLPAKKCKLESQPQFARRADRTAEVRVRFQSLEPNRSNAVSRLGVYHNNYVLEEDTDEQDLSVRYDRKWFSLDNDIGTPIQYDVTGFTHQDFAWFAKGRAAHWQLRGLFYTLMGRLMPLWLSSGMIDFELVTPMFAVDTTMLVKRVGYTDMGGPFKHRDHIVIQLRDGVRLYREIIAAANVGDLGEHEQLAIDVSLGRDVGLRDVRRISFLTISRLDQDQIEFLHPVDTQGVTTVNAVFRTAVNTGAGPAPPEPFPAVLFQVPAPVPAYLSRAAYINITTMLQSAGPLAGVGSTPTGIYSIWFRQITTYPGAESGLEKYWYDFFCRLSSVLSVPGDSSFPEVRLTSGGSEGGVYNFLFNPVNNDVPRVTQLMTDFNPIEINQDDGHWHHIIFAWDLSTANPYTMFHLYVDGVSRRDMAADVIGTIPPTTIDYSSGPVNVFGTFPPLHSTEDGMIAELYFAPGQYLDLSNPANLAKFYNAGYAVELGSTGSTPTGTAPAVYLSGPGGPGYPFSDNRGTGGPIDIVVNTPDTNHGVYNVDATIWSKKIGEIFVYGPAPFPRPRDPFPGTPT
jgi:hypothetical protein